LVHVGRWRGVVSARKELLDELATALEGLRAFKPASKADVDLWFQLARKLEARLVMKGGLSPEVPSILWNYLADADIRFKDAKYADLQDRQMRLLVRYLKRGEMPPDDELKEYS
jgi:hypothetical protein